jgi:hypothetical protein
MAVQMRVLLRQRDASRNKRALDLAALLTGPPDHISFVAAGRLYEVRPKWALLPAP